MSSALDALALPPVRHPPGERELRAEVRAFLAEQPFTPRCDAWGSAWGASPEFTRALAARLAKLQEGGATEIAFQPAGPDIPRELASFAEIFARSMS